MFDTGLICFLVFHFVACVCLNDILGMPLSLAMIENQSFYATPVRMCLSDTERRHALCAYFLLEIDVICYNIFTIQQILAFPEYKATQHVLLLEVEKSFLYSYMISPIYYLAQISSFIYYDHVLVWIAIPFPGTKSALMFTSCVRIENHVICLA